MPSRPPIRGPFRVDERARAAYAEGAGIYRIVPRAVCLPADVDDLVMLMRWAGDERVPLVPRGAGSAMPGSNVGDGVVVDLTAMRGPRLEVQASARRAVMRAGASLSELDTAAAPHGLRLPPDPSSWRWATAGGVVSTNAAGARSFRYGSVRDWVLALEIVTADGETAVVRRGSTHPARSAPAALQRFAAEAAPAIAAAADLIAERFPKVHKSSCGYALDAYLRSGDLLDLMIGAEGTLALVTSVTWRLDPAPRHRSGLRIALADYEPLAELVALLRAPTTSAVELLDQSFLELLAAHGQDTARSLCDAGAAAVLLVELEDDDPVALRAATQAAVASARPRAQSVEAAFVPAVAERLWQLRHAASPILAGLPARRRSLQVIEDGCVPVERLGEYVAAIRTAAAARNLPVVIFGHAGDGNVHVNVLPEVDQPGWEAQVAGLLEEVTATVIQLGGVPSGEHGDGRLRAAFLERIYGRELVALFQAVKRSFDPLALLNPGVILPSGEPPIDRLKAGAGAAPLPSDIAEALREIERRAAYTVPRLALADDPESVAARLEARPAITPFPRS